MSSAVDPWWEFDQTQHGLRQNTLDRLKAIINGLNAECGTNISKSGRKQEILVKIQDALHLFKAQNDVDRWQKARVVVHQVRSSGTYTPQRITTSGFHAAATNGAYGSVKPKTQPMTPTTVPHPYGSVPRPSTSAIHTAPSRSSITFKPSPFLRVEQVVTQVIECPESHTSADRRTGAITFSLTPDQRAKLSLPDSIYQLRLYCTSSTYYGTYRSNHELCPIEFPPTCEVRVNGVALNANLKGLKKKPGTAPPANLGTAIRQDQTNRVEMVYVNSAQNAPPKKYYITVQLVAVTTVEQLVDRLRKGKYRDGATIAQTMKQQAAQDDDDIVAGPQKMSLRDSLTLCRVVTPCRSSRCVHPQCFDAATWFSMMEQTTTWVCPVCDKVLNTDELIVDGYFEDILKQTPDDIDDVIVEADGEWHTADNKYASPAWKATHPIAPPAVKRSATPKPVAKEPPRAEEILVVDSDEEDEEGQVKRQLSSGFRESRASANSSFNGTLPPSSRSATPTGPAAVIDLTLSDSDDEAPAASQRSAPPPPPAFPAPPSVAPIVAAGPIPASQKRKTSEDQSPTENVWKKSRSADYAPPNGAAYPPASHAPGGHPPGGHVAAPPATSYSGGHTYAAHRDVPPPVDDRYSRYRSPPRQDGAVYGVYNYAPPPPPPHNHSSSHSRHTSSSSSSGYRNGYSYPSSSSSHSSRMDGSSASSGRW